MDKDEIQAKIAHKQKLINLEKDQDKRNNLYHDVSVLQLRLDMDSTHEKIMKLTNRD
jgi:hypothetical protein